ncbi:MULTISPECIES: hypothetical protein [Pseudofrankia]|uniref:hypothetical protein n=1 Tax=Pseudofrankia TaxID=2994363 RepID=UPI000234D3E8|nr:MULTISPECIES: hypothetical protein [Pseudofrankia]OHV27913.1 hypothetical protein BCD49_38455 [Pseudofrankia sp. EUN1h]
MAIPQVPDDVSKLDLTAVRAGYLKLAKRDIRRLRKDALSRPDPYSLDEYAQFHVLDDAWEGLPQADTLFFTRNLRTAVAMLTAFEGVLDGLRGRTSLTKNTARPPGMMERAAIVSAVTTVSLVGLRVSLGIADDMIANLFRFRGDSTEGLNFVKGTYLAMVQSLGRLIDETTGAAGPLTENRGFMIDPGLPANMPALASGSGPGSFIRVSPAAIEGSPLVLASSLAHEGTHTVPGAHRTIDFVYKNSGAHYRLNSRLAVRNAANYEQLTTNLLQTEPQRAAYMPDAQALVVDLLRTRVTRAWVLGAEIGRFEYDVPATEQERKKALSVGYSQEKVDSRDRQVRRRRDLATILNALVAQVGKDLADALFTDLNDSLSHHMDTIFKQEITLRTDAGLQVVLGDRPLGRPLRAWPNTLEELFRHVVGALAEWQVIDGRVADTGPQIAFLETIGQYEETEFKNLLDEYVQSLGRKYQRVAKPALGPI